jgi:hypothetical protein
MPLMLLSCLIQNVFQVAVMFTPVSNISTPIIPLSTFYFLALEHTAKPRIYGRIHAVPLLPLEIASSGLHLSTFCLSSVNCHLYHFQFWGQTKCLPLAGRFNYREVGELKGSYWMETKSTDSVNGGAFCSALSTAQKEDFPTEPKTTATYLTLNRE